MAGQGACGGFRYVPLLFPAAGHVRLINDRSIAKQSLQGSFYLSFSTYLPFPGSYILFIYLQGYNRFLHR